MSLGVDRTSQFLPVSVPHESSSHYSSIAEGFVSLLQPETELSVASAPRCARNRNGEIVCTFIAQERLGQNDFTPVLARSKDGGLTWSEQGLLWPHLRKWQSIFGSVSASPEGELFFFGIQTPIDSPGEAFWCEATQGMKLNSLVWAHSIDEGRTWSDPQPIPRPLPGSAEAPGALCVARDGAWHVCYSPYNSFDAAVVVPRNQVVLLSSLDRGNSWRHATMLRFPDELSTGAEAWVVELADGRLLGTCWNLNQRDGSDFPNAFALSHDGGITWTPTRSTGIMGQASALAPLADGSVLFVYNQRKHGRTGVWLARAMPTDEAFNVRSNEIVWAAQGVSSHNGHGQWTQFTFGEPSVIVLDDSTILVVFWTLEGGQGAIRYVKLAVHSKVPLPHVPLT